tara:strand:+ start:3359 stop:6736 length:3378 start_codon:yes stop_codon:yes gene_type:complete
MRRLIFINKVGKNENSYVVGSNIGGQSRFVRNALKKHASNNSQGLCCDGKDNYVKNGKWLIISYTVSNFNITDLTEFQKQELINIVKNDYSLMLNIDTGLIIVDLIQGSLVVNVSINPITPNLERIKEILIRDEYLNNSVKDDIKKYLDPEVTLGTVSIATPTIVSEFYDTPIPSTEYQICLTPQSNVNIIPSNGNKYVFNGGSTYNPFVRYGLNTGYYEFKNISSGHPLAILNIGKTDKITYIGDAIKKSNESVTGTTADGNYDFYYGDIRVYVYGNFGTVSVYCQHHGYMGGEYLLKYNNTCPSDPISNPAITITSGTVNHGDTTNNSTIDLIFTTSIPTTNFTIGDITIVNGTLGALSGSGNIYTATFTPAGAGARAIATNIKINAGVFTDNVGNINDASPEFVWIFDSIQPIILITAGSVNDGDTTNDASIDLNFAFSKPTDNFVVGDINVTNGTLTNFSGSGNLYVVTFTPTVVGPTSVNIVAGVFTDYIGNTNIEATQFDWIFFNTQPTMSITSATTVTSGQTTNDGFINLSFIPSLSTADFVGSDINVFGGSLNGTLTAVGNAYSAIFTPTGGAGPKGISVSGGKFSDQYGNFNQPTTLFEWFYSPVPTMTISSTTVTSGTTTNDASIELTFTSSLPTSNFVEGDITVNGGTLSLFNADTTTIYKATFTPSGPGATTIYVGVAQFTDDVGGNNTASNTFNWTYTTTPAPTMTITSTTVANGSTTTNETIDLTFNSTASTDNFVLGDINVANGTLGAFSGSGTTYNATFTPTETGATTIDISAGAYTESTDGISNLEATQFNWTYTPIPTMTIISTTVPPGSSTTDETIDLTFTSSASTNNFVLGDINVTNGSLGSLSGTETTYFATFTPLPGGGTTSINVPGSVFTDQATGVNNEATSTFNWTYTPIPTMTITSSTVSSGDTTNNTSIALTFTSSLSISTGDFVEGDITVTNGTLSLFNAVSTTIYTATFTPDAEGIATINVAESVFTDDTNGLSNTASNTFNWNYNETETYEINVTANGTSSYNLTASNPLGATSGGLNSTVSMNVGDTVNFNVSAAFHPFYIKTIEGTGTANQVSTPAATNQGAEVATVSWTPITAGTYYYVCSSHSSMFGEIIVS